jgi:hypothetical protein
MIEELDDDQEDFRQPDQAGGVAITWLPSSRDSSARDQDEAQLRLV